MAKLTVSYGGFDSLESMFENQVKNLVKEKKGLDTKLTKDADKLISVIYKWYLEKRKDGTPKGRAKIIGSSELIHNSILPKWSFPDVDETCRELHRKGFLQCEYSNNVVDIAVLTDDAIIYMENRFPDGLNQVLGYISKIVALLP